MTPTLPALSFIVPVRDDAVRLRTCLGSIKTAAAGVPIELVVADNGSKDDSVAAATSCGATVISAADITVAEMRNRGAGVAHGELLAFVDADHELDSGWVAAATTLFRDPSIAAAGAQYRSPVGGTWVQRTYDRFRRHAVGVRDVEWLPSGNLVVRREVFQRLGGFDTSLQTCEDVDLCHRVRASGGRVVAADGLLSVHRGDPSTLRALFLGELWRGRDNLRVTLRGPWTSRSLASLAVPFVYLLALLAVAAGLLTWPLGGAWLAATGTMTIGLLVILRAGMLLAHGGPVSGRWEPAQTVAVALVYDLARSLALFSRSSHQVRRRG